MRRRSRTSRVPSGRLLLNRERELSQLQRAFAATRSGRGQIVLIAGEPGAGKTTLAQAFAAGCATRGAHVLWGRSGDRDASPPYWPWAEALRSLVGPKTAHQRRALLGSRAHDISLILPELRQAMHGEGRSSVSHDESARYRLADAVRKCFHRTAGRRCVVLVLEDLHWADQGSSFLLEFMAPQIGEHAWLILATYRAGEVAAPLAKTLGELARLGVTRIDLSGLTLDGTARLMARVAGRRPTKRVAAHVHARTSGNPFFVTEIARLASRDWRVIPGNVQAAISTRLHRLSALANRMLVAAAILGREFDFPLLRAALSTVDEEALLTSIDEGLQALVIEPLPSRGAEWYQFKHALIRDALYDQISPSRRARGHALATRALERLVTNGADDRTAELAWHAACAGTLIEPAVLAKYSTIAGERLLAAHAFEEALGHFERAWAARQQLSLDADAAATLVGLGCAQAATSVRWNRQEGWVTLRRAIEYYLRTGDAGRAIAAATDPRITAEGTTGAAATIQQVREITPPDSIEEGWLLARLGAAMYFETGEHEPAQALLRRALGIAATKRVAGLELRTRAYASAVHHFDLRWPEVLAESARVRGLAQRVDDLHWATYAGYRAGYALIQTGHSDQAALEAEATLAMAERLKDHGLLADALYLKSALAQLRGEWREARIHNDRALALSSHLIPSLHSRALLEYETGHRTAGGRYLQQLLAAERRAGPYPLGGTFAAMALSQVAHVWEDDATCDAALRAARVVLERRPMIPLTQVTARMCCGLVAIRRLRRDDCEEELHFLQPFKGMFIVPGLLTDRLLGMLAQSAGHLRHAVAHFEDALALCRRSGYHPELAWTCYHYARALLDVGRGEDRQRAAILLDEGQGLASRFGLGPLVDAIAAFRERHGVRLDPRPVGLTTRELEILGLLSMGRTNKEIADALWISANTVAVHVTRVLSKTGSSNRTEAASYAMRHRLVSVMSPDRARSAQPPESPSPAK